MKKSTTETKQVKALTPEQQTYVQTNCTNQTITKLQQGIASDLNQKVTKHQISTYLKENNLSYIKEKRIKLSDAERTYIAHNHRYKSLKQMAAHLNRPFYTIRNYCISKGFKVLSEVVVKTREKLKMIKEVYVDKGLSSLKEKIEKVGVTRTTFNKYLNMLRELKDQRVLSFEQKIIERQERERVIKEAKAQAGKEAKRKARVEERAKAKVLKVKEKAKIKASKQKAVLEPTLIVDKRIEQSIVNSFYNKVKPGMQHTTIMTANAAM